MKYLTILGSTGSIGSRTIDVIKCNPKHYSVIALVANKNVKRIFKQCLEIKPRYAVMNDNKSANQLKLLLLDNGTHVEVLSGQNAICEIAALEETNIVMSAIAGTAGLLPTISAINAGKIVLLANKESLITCGKFLMERVKKRGARILPVDSEINAIFQCLPKDYQQNIGEFNLKEKGVSSILLTGSGGPFYKIPMSELSKVTPEEACFHPNWMMGRKISVDSATMMNKGLEYIECRWLFNASEKQINILIHPQSIIHSMVNYIDGSIIAQLSKPDMRISIAYVLASPNRINSGVQALDFSKLNSLTFDTPNYTRYPCLKLAMQAFDRGQAIIIALNAANEVAVNAFLNHKIKFTEIAEFNMSILDNLDLNEPNSIESVLEIDKQIKFLVKEKIIKFSQSKII